MSLTREQILAADDLQREVVEVPEWGKDSFIKVRMMTATERERFQQLLLAKNGATPAANTAVLVAMTACAEDGALLFSEADVEALARKSGVVVGRIAAKAWTLNQLGAAERKKLAKN